VNGLASPEANVLTGKDFGHPTDLESLGAWLKSSRFGTFGTRAFGLWRAALIPEVDNMGRSLLVKLFFGSLIGFVAGAVVLVVAGAVAIGNDVFVMNGPDVVGLNSGPLTWTVIGLMALASLIVVLAAIAQVVAWIGAVLDTATRPDKTWFVALLVLGLLGFGFVATLLYVIAVRDETPAQAPMQPISDTPNWRAQASGPATPNGQLLGSGQAGGQPPASR
jgi:hypothetical protein